ncbi:uncharacterized protein LOC143329615 [Chaetodon auriga]|uniref:uncharacterized protein LOC143329615 n=1 Tax=Chaetodon auriga TaxID=39042 RepID=UPI004032B310
MVRTVLLFAVFLLHEAKDTSAEIPVFVRTGGDMFLNLESPVSLEDGDFIWKFNDSDNIVKLQKDEAKIPQSYQGRAEFSKHNYSLILRNVAKSDSGRYVALVSGDKDRRVAEFKVTVQDPVRSVELAVKSTGFCNLTVTCSAVDSDFSSTVICDNQTCSKERGQGSKATTDPSSINIYLEQGFIICNHSNHVSWEHMKMDIKTFCGPRSVPNGVTTIAICTGSGIVCGVVVLLFLFRKYVRKNSGNTVYADPQDFTPARTQHQDPTEDASGLSPTSTYSTVAFPTAPSESNMTKKGALPETVYAEVQRSAMDSYTTNTMT